MLSGHLSVLREIWRAPGNASNRPLAVLRAARWFIACHRKPAADDRPALLHPAFGDRVYPCYTDSIIAKHVMYRSEWFDYDLLHFMAEFLRPGDHFLDVGANTGLHTLLAATRVTTGRITCVEPDPKNLARLRLALDLNRITNATVLPVAASDTSGRALLEGADVFTRIAPCPPSGNSDPREIETARLDSCLGPDAWVDFCKIDVEGAEWQVLRGLTGLMDRDALPVMVFEMNGSLHAYGHTGSDFFAWLRGQGYTLAAYRHEDRRLSSREPLADTDLFALSRSGLDLVRNRMGDIALDLP